MSFFELPVRRPVAVAVLVLGVIIIGLLFGSRINIESFPRIEVPVASISCIYPGAGPQEVEEQITKVIEDAVGGISNIKDISSYSSEGFSVVVIEFNYGTNMDLVMSDIREKLDAVKNKLPRAIRPPSALKVDPASVPIVRLAITGTGDLQNLRTLADDDVKKRLEQVPGVASVTVFGGKEREILVAVDRGRLDAYGLTVGQVTSAIVNENLDIPAGRITASNLEFGLRFRGQFRSLSDIENIAVGQAAGHPVFLRDVARVEDTNKQIRTRTRFNGVNAISLEILKNTDANTVVVAGAIKKTLPEINRLLPAGARAQLAYDGSTSITTAIDNLKDTALEGAVLAVAVILLFLGSVYSTLVIALSIPISIVATFLLMYFAGLTINMMTLTGLILGIGRIVDDSIVVLENVFRHREMGKSPFQAAVDGTREVGLAVLAATLTTISVFVPLFLIPGLMGQVFRPLATTFAFALLVSLAVAVTVIPMLASRLLAREAHQGAKGGGNGILGRLLRAWERFWEMVVSIYRHGLDWALRHRPAVVVTGVVVLIISLMLSAVIKQDFFGQWDTGAFTISIDTPVGSSMARTDEVVQDLEALVRTQVPEASVVTADAGRASSGSVTLVGASSDIPYQGGLTISMVDRGNIWQYWGNKIPLLTKIPGLSLIFGAPEPRRFRTTAQVEDFLRRKFKDIPGAQIRVQDMFKFSGKKPVEIYIKGYDPDVLISLADRLMTRMKEVKGLQNLDLNWRRGNPEYHLAVDRDKAARVGLSYAAVASQVRTLVTEDQTSTYREAGKEFDLVVQLPQTQRRTLDDLLALKIATPTGSMVPLAELVKVDLKSGPSQISRNQRSRFISIQGDISGSTLGEVKKELLKILGGFDFPQGYTYEFQGEEADRQESFGQLNQVLYLALILIYVLLAVQFESFIHPLTIMLAIPLELSGVFLGLLVSGRSLTIFAMLGIIMLTGIVVSNSILLINYIIVLRHQGLERGEAVRRAGPVRLRPILMTSLATVMAMIPLALGLRPGSEMFSPLAVGVMGGLITSTFLTLFIVPVVYTLFDDLGRKLSGARADSESGMAGTPPGDLDSDSGPGGDQFSIHR